MVDRTVGQVFDSMSEEKKQAVYHLLGSIDIAADDRSASPLARLSEEERKVVKFMVDEVLKDKVFFSG